MKKSSHRMPPKWIRKFLGIFLDPKTLEASLGDLEEKFQTNTNSHRRWKANALYVLEGLGFIRMARIKKTSGKHLSTYGMYKSYFTIGWRNLLRNKGYSVINIGGLSIGMTVAMFIGLWIYDELSFNRYHANYEHIARVYSCETSTQTSAIGCSESIQLPVALTLRNSYPQYFKQVIVSWWGGDFTLATPDKKFNRNGIFIEGGVLEMLSLKMLQGSYASLANPNSVVLSRSAAETIFGDEDPINKTLTIHGHMVAEVTGIFEDIPRNSDFAQVQFFAPFSLWLSVNDWAQGKETDWDNRPFSIYAQLQPGVTMEDANAAIKDLYARHVPADFYKTVERFKPFPQLVPMSTWHLYGEFENGKPARGRITYVWLFGTVGVCVLLLACINFVNLSTARSEKRAREVGVRKTMGSVKGQLMLQFISESFMVVVIAFIVSIVLLMLLKSPFNELADKDISVPFYQANFWIIALSFIVVTGFMAGVYPAFYLSSFQPVRVLKGVLHSGRLGSLPRKILVVVQFTVSVVLIIGTLIVYDQLEFARSRPVGYDRRSLIYIMLNHSYWGKVDAVQSELLRSGVVAETSTSSSPLTAVWNYTSGYSWPGKDPGLDAEFAVCNVTRNFGKTVGWELADGRDFSDELATDSLDAIIINEAAVKYMGLKDPVGQPLTDVDEFGNKKWTKTIIGVVKDLVMESPYDPVRPTLYYYHPNGLNVLHIRIAPSVTASVALQKIGEVVNRVVPDAVFDYEFTDVAYVRKFSQEQRVGKLSGVFSVLAMLISCLGLLGLASFVAERRTKEIGIRKVVGASVFGLWKMLSKDFVLLVIISCFIAVPIAYYLMRGWLSKYQYHTGVSGWIVFGSCAAAMVLTLLTVSYQAIRAARANPVKSLRTE
jgi:putative ABC transport system permease protein